jgi:hypothetical protein
LLHIAQGFAQLVSRLTLPASQAANRFLHLALDCLEFLLHLRFLVGEVDLLLRRQAALQTDAPAVLPACLQFASRLPHIFLQAFRNLRLLPGQARRAARNVTE